MLVCEQGSEQWKRERAECVTGTDMSALMGSNKYKSYDELLQEKAFPEKVPEWKDNAATWFGRFYEEANLKAFGCLFGVVPVHSNTFYRRGRIGATIDGKVLYGAKAEVTEPWLKNEPWVSAVENILRGDGTTLIEMKSTEIFGAKQWAAGVPLYYWQQVQTQLYVAQDEFDKAVICCRLGSKGIVAHPILPDEDFWAEAELAVADFWKAVERKRNE